jgi:AraC family transcriptional activator of mtrCDE
VTLHFVLSGRGRLRMPGGGVVPLSPHSLVLVPAHSAHHIEVGDPVDHESTASAPTPRDDDLDIFEAGPKDASELSLVCGLIQARYASGLGLFDRLRGPLALDFSDSPQMRSVFDRMLAEERQRSAMTGPMMTALMNEAMILLFRRLCVDPDCPLPWLAAMEDPKLAAPLALMLERPEQAHTLDLLADSAAMSRSTFAAAFSEAHGRSPMVYLREVRMRRAAALLGGTDLTVDQIASRVGYSSRSQFSRAFSSQFGESPTASRRSPGIAGSALA